MGASSVRHSSALVRTFVCATVALLALSFFSQPTFAQGRLVGTWTLVWEGARDNYTGTLNVATKVSDALFKGKLHLIKSDGTRVNEDASITLDGDDVRIECSNVSVKGWIPDRFYVKREGTRMTGYSLDASGQRGRQIVFTLRQ